MPLIVSLVVAAFVATCVVAGARWLGDAGDPTPNPRSPDRFLVDWLMSHDRGRRVVELLDRFVWGGTMLSMGLVVLVGAAAAVGFLLVDVSTGAGLARFDQSAAEWGSSNASDWSTEALTWITDLGSTGILLTAMAVIGLIELARTRRVTPLAFLLTVGIGVSVINGVLKQLIDRDRPAVEALVSSGGSAFPSGHSAVAAACWAALALVVSRRWPYGRRRWATALGAGVGALVAASRVMLGVHWLTDVAAGLVVGWAWCLLAALVYGTNLQQFGHPAAVVASGEENGSASPATSVDRDRARRRPDVGARRDEPSDR